MQALPLGFFLFLAELAAGGIVVSALLDRDGEVSGGFLFLNGIFLVAFGAGAIWLRSVLPAGRLLGLPEETVWLMAEVPAWIVFLASASIWLACIRTGRRSAGRAWGAIASVAALGASAVSGLANGGATLAAVPLTLTLIAGGLALGTVWSGMMLGHWYLVTPRLAPRPLLRLNAALAVILAIQAALFLWATATQSGISPDVNWMFALRAGVGIMLPLLLALPIWRTARVRSMMSATGLLYISLGLVLSGEIIAKSLFFLTGTAT